LRSMALAVGGGIVCSCIAWQQKPVLKAVPFVQGCPGSAEACTDIERHRLSKRFVESPNRGVPISANHHCLGRFAGWLAGGGASSAGTATQWLWPNMVVQCRLAAC
jgi:hypothetical protein